jgi:hypothetical protein
VIHRSWLETYVMYFGFAAAFSSWRGLRLRRIWISLGVSVVCVIGLMITFAMTPPQEDIDGWREVLVILAMAGWIIGWGYSFFTLLSRHRRIADLVARVELADEWGGEIVMQVKQRYRIPRDDLQELLPLIEPLGHAPGHPMITPAWVRAQLAKAEEMADSVAGLLQDAPNILPIKKQPWWKPSDL